MDQSSALACLAFVTSFFAAAAGMLVLLDAVERSRRESAVHAAIGGGSDGSGGPGSGSGSGSSSSFGSGPGGPSGLAGAVGSSYVRRVLLNGYPQFRSISDLALRWGTFRSLILVICWWLGEKGFLATPTGLFEAALAAGGVSGLAALLVLGSALPGVACVAAALAVMVILSGRLRTRRRESMREEVPDVLHAMSACFKSGFSLQQTFHHLAKEVHGPLRDCFSRAASSLDLGYPTDQVLQALRRDADVPEMAFVCVALEVQHQAGGSMQGILNSAKETVATELSLHRSLRVQTAQAKLSAQIVTAMPFVLVAVISLMSEDFLAPFFSSLPGFVMLVVALCMQVAGIAIARRMLQVGEL